MNPILNDFNKILGCGKEDGFKRKCGNIFEVWKEGKTGKVLEEVRYYCPSCSKAKEVFLERCQNELEFLLFIEDKGLSEFNQEQIKWRISQLKEVLEKKK